MKLEQTTETTQNTNFNNMDDLIFDLNSLDFDFPNLDIDINLDLETDLDINSDSTPVTPSFFQEEDSIYEIKLKYGDSKELLLNITDNFDVAKDYNPNLKERYTDNTIFYLLPEGKEIINYKLLGQFREMKTVQLNKDTLTNTNIQNFQRELIKNHLLYVPTEPTKTNQEV